MVVVWQAGVEAMSLRTLYHRDTACVRHVDMSACVLCNVATLYSPVYLISKSPQPTVASIPGPDHHRIYHRREDFPTVVDPVVMRAWDRG